MFQSCLICNLIQSIEFFCEMLIHDINRFYSSVLWDWAMLLTQLCDVKYFIAIIIKDGNLLNNAFMVCTIQFITVRFVELILHWILFICIDHTIFRRRGMVFTAELFLFYAPRQNKHICLCVLHTIILFVLTFCTCKYGPDSEW